MKNVATRNKYERDAGRRARRLRSVFLIAVLIGMLVLISGFVGSWFMARSLLAPVRIDAGPPPGDLAATAVAFESESGAMIHGWHVSQVDERGVIVLVHGIRATRRSMVARARFLADSGYAVLLIDLQAHGESSGEIITAGHREQHDVRAAVEFARSQHPGTPIGLIGISLGGASAVLASPLSIDAMVLESVYTDIAIAIDHRVRARLGMLATIATPILMRQLEWQAGISRNDLRPMFRMQDLDCPVFVMSGLADRSTTVGDTRALFDSARGPKDLWLIAGAGHVDLHRFDPVEYEARVGAFFNRHLRAERK